VVTQMRVSSEASDDMSGGSGLRRDDETIAAAFRSVVRQWPLAWTQLPGLAEGSRGRRTHGDRTRSNTATPNRSLVTPRRVAASSTSNPDWDVATIPGRLMQELR